MFSVTPACTLYLNNQIKKTAVIIYHQGLMIYNYCCFIGQYDDLAALQVQYSLSPEVI